MMFLYFGRPSIGSDESIPPGKAVHLSGIRSYIFTRSWTLPHNRANDRDGSCYTYGLYWFYNCSLCYNSFGASPEQPALMDYIGSEWLNTDFPLRNPYIRNYPLASLVVQSSLPLQLLGCSRKLRIWKWLMLWMMWNSMEILSSPQVHLWINQKKPGYSKLAGSYHRSEHTKNKNFELFESCGKS